MRRLTALALAVAAVALVLFGARLAMRTVVVNQEECGHALPVAIRGVHTHGGERSPEQLATDSRAATALCQPTARRLAGQGIVAAVFGLAFGGAAIHLARRRRLLHPTG